MGWPQTVHVSLVASCALLAQLVFYCFTNTIPENFVPPPPPPPQVSLTLPPCPFCPTTRIFDRMSECRNTHLQQPTDWNTMHSDTTMSTAPTYATLLNSTSSSEEESSNPGNPPSSQTVVGSTLNHGGLKHPAVSHTHMEATNEDKTFEDDLKIQNRKQSILL